MCVEVAVFSFERTEAVKHLEMLSEYSPHGAPVKYVL